MIWKKHFTLEQLNEMGKHCAVGHLGIEISAYGENWIEAKMPVDHRTTQPFGVLHGGVSVALAETIGSFGGISQYRRRPSCLGVRYQRQSSSPSETRFCYRKGNANCFKSKYPCWQIDIRDEQDKLCCVSRLTLSIKHL